MRRIPDHRPLRTAAFLLVLLGAGLVARAATWQVTMGQDDRFHPSILTISRGDSVSWENGDAYVHTSTSGSSTCVPDQIWNSGNVLPGATWGRTFRSGGTFSYYCAYHCAYGMTGTITVLQNTPVESRTWGEIRAIYR